MIRTIFVTLAVSMMAFTTTVIAVGVIAGFVHGRNAPAPITTIHFIHCDGPTPDAECAQFHSGGSAPR